MAGFPDLAILKLQIFKKEVRKSDMSILSTANLMKQYGKEPNPLAAEYRQILVVQLTKLKIIYPHAS